MGKLAKPQRSKKQKKLKAVDPFYTGERKNRLQEGLNQKPKSMSQEIPRKLKNLGFFIDDLKSGNTGKKSRNKFITSPDAPVKFNKIFSAPLGSHNSDSQRPETKMKNITSEASHQQTEPGKTERKRGNKKKPKLKKEDVEEYIDNLQAPRPFVKSVNFKQIVQESDRSFMRRVNMETHAVMAKSKIDDQYDVSDEKKIVMMVKAKKSKMNEKKKKRSSERKKRKLEVLKEKKRDKMSDFSALQDKVEFGEVVHAPPALKTVPKKATAVDHDRPGLRMPELKAAINKNIEEATTVLESFKPLAPRTKGQSRKRKSMSVPQQQMEDSKRNNFIEAYRQLKVKTAKLKSE